MTVTSLDPARDRPRWRALGLPLLYTATIFLSAGLLFFVQPLFAKLVLPHIGGAPAVWTTAMLFFQTVLIAGYLYAHLLVHHVAPRAQVWLHLALWAAALAFLPLAVAEGWRYDPERSTVLQTLALFAAGVGLPFAVLSANAPLIQAWYARSGGPSAQDPYFLYGASNLGSMAALLAFPLAAEPLFGASAIGAGWAWGFVALGVLLLASGLAAARGGWESPAAPAAAPRTATTAPVALPLDARRIALWLVLAFVPSALMLAVTTKISTDMGAVPLVWAVPLALYLTTFVLAFTNRPLIGARVREAAFLAALGFLALTFSGIVPIHLSLLSIAALASAFFAVALHAHRLLYEARPAGAQLTLFYVVMSVGGALGGLFNSVLAPWLFDRLWEGAVAVALAAALPLLAAGPGAGRLRRHAALGVLAAAALFMAPRLGVAGGLGREAIFALGGALFAAAALGLGRSRVALAAAMAGVLALAVLDARGGTLLRERSFFGTHKVAEDPDRDLRLYTNGTTVHGAQRLSEIGAARPTPLYYYHPDSPLAQVLASDRGRSAERVGIVGLGVGALACYARPGQDWYFYEIDAVVDRVARESGLFTYLSACTPEAPTHLGDARIVLAGQDIAFDVLVIDAYSSDAVPVHLTTTEAMEIYLDRLAPGGMLLYHISNRYYDISRPLARSAEALGLEMRVQRYRGDIDADPSNVPSTVALLARPGTDLGALASDPRWVAAASDGGRLWTDDYANLLGILR